MSTSLETTWFRSTYKRTSHVTPCEVLGDEGNILESVGHWSSIDLSGSIRIVELKWSNVLLIYNHTEQCIHVHVLLILSNLGLNPMDWYTIAEDFDKTDSNFWLKKMSDKMSNDLSDVISKTWFLSPLLCSTVGTCIVYHSTVECCTYREYNPDSAGTRRDECLVGDSRRLVLVDGDKDIEVVQE